MENSVWHLERHLSAFEEADRCHHQRSDSSIMSCISGEEPLSRTPAALGIRFVEYFFLLLAFYLLSSVATAERNHNLLDPKNLKPKQRLRFTIRQTRRSDSKRRVGGGCSESIPEMNCPRRSYQIREITSFWSLSL